eukprot:GHVL01005059.1.p1 GENE.GHVL01005059.1~~GHVL01005059.1.p1  ORF type:complete len:151 (+),score=20.10 GHVL01005059.1:35-487(+)
MPPLKYTIFNEIPDDFKLPEGDAKRGSRLFKKHCSQCHSIYPDGRSLTRTIVAPTMWNICDRTAGQLPSGGIVVSEQMKSSGIVWNDANLMRYMKCPQAFSDSSLTMNFNGLPDFQKRVDICHFLHTLSYSHPDGQAVLDNKPNLTAWQK